MRLNQEIGNSVMVLRLLVTARKGWRLILIACLAGGIVSTIAAFVIPEKFKAEALLQTGKVLGKEIEPILLLNEKMRLPNYYSQATIQGCELKTTESSFPGEKLAKDLNPTVARNSSFIYISFLASKPLKASECLNWVINDVIRNQMEIAGPKIARAKDDLRIATKRLETAEIKRAQELKLIRQKLSLSREKLLAAQKFVDQFQGRAQDYSFDDGKFSASSLLAATLASKQIEVKDLELEINNLEMRESASLSAQDDEILSLQRQIDEITKLVSFPETQNASFAAPIFSPNYKVAPKRAQIILLGVSCGIIIGFGIILFRSSRVWLLLTK